MSAHTLAAGKAAEAVQRGNGRDATPRGAGHRKRAEAHVVKRRGAELLPQVMLTLLSIIQAIALELLWTRTMASEYLFAGSLVAVAGWFQVAAVAIGIVQVWLLYTNLVLRFAWAPRSRDSIFPFAIGLLEFAVIETLGPRTAPLWFVWMGLVFAFATYVSNDTFHFATRDSGDSGDAISTAGARDFQVGLAAGGGHLVLGGFVWLAGGFGWVALVAFVAVNAMIVHQMRSVDRYLKDAYAQPEDALPEDAER